MKEAQKSEELKRSLTIERLNNTRLNSVRIELTSHQRIESIAVTQLGMIKATPGDMVAEVKKSETRKSDSYTLLDHISPSLEALISK